MEVKKALLTSGLIVGSFWGITKCVEYRHPLGAFDLRADFYDEDSDNKLSLTESSRLIMTEFDRILGNKDGLISQDEVERVKAYAKKFENNPNPLLNETGRNITLALKLIKEKVGSRG